MSRQGVDPSCAGICVFNRQRTIPLRIARLQAFADEAAAGCVAYFGPAPAALPTLRTVEISIVSDRTISRIHRRFLGVSGPTDVITFDHGEIFVSATTAVRQAQVEQEELHREIARYIVHGLLHLNGHLDEAPADAAAMWTAQETVLASLWK